MWYPWCSGYHVSLTYLRSPVRSRMESLSFFNPCLSPSLFTIRFEGGARERRPTVGRYSVHLHAFEELALPTLSQKTATGKPVSEENGSSLVMLWSTVPQD